MVSKKRKADGPTEKFYAVRYGRSPGVYGTWAECQAQTAGFAGAKCNTEDKSFFNFDDAEAFVAGENPSTATDGTKQEKFYAVAIGRDPGIYTDWDVAAEAIKGWKGPKYKKFDTRAEAVEYIRTYGNEAGQLSIQDEDIEPPPRKASSLLPAARTTALCKSGLMGAVCQMDALAPPLASVCTLAPVTLGISIRNPWHFARLEKLTMSCRNVSERLEGDLQTNQRAELTAILRALEQVSDDQDVRILTDSKYSINCVTEWYVKWEKNGWKTQNKEVKNRDLIELVREKIDDRDSLGTDTLFQWVKGHANDPGNVAADQLAVLGARS
ncbi:uncharacterized protein PG998_009755 [Apiospora kogelbergensis]|uniref:uncharacterized protein n=1 Tax=Apiospora kogelbergensis TaxID=1337665 RepID=UPI00312DAC2C